jgi:hypothetical protein
MWLPLYRLSDAAEVAKSRSMPGKKVRNLLSDACAGTGDQRNLAI